MNAKRLCPICETGEVEVLRTQTFELADIVAFADNNPINHDKILQGKPGLPPQELAKWDAPILIATLPSLHCQTNSRDGIKK